MKTDKNLDHLVGFITLTPCRVGFLYYDNTEYKDYLGLIDITVDYNVTDGLLHQWY